MLQCCVTKVSSIIVLFPIFLWYSSAQRIKFHSEDLFAGLFFAAEKMADTNIKISAAQCMYACVLFIFLMASLTTGQTLNTACIEVKKAYSSDKGFNENDVSLTAISGRYTKINNKSDR